VSLDVDPDDGFEDEGPFFAWLPPPDDRLWRHPSEIGASLSAGLDATQDFDAAHSFGSPHGDVATALHLSPVRTWTVAVVAGLVGALLVSGVSMATGNFGARTTVNQNVTRVAAPDTVAFSETVPSAVPVPNWPAVESALAASVVAVLASNGSAGSGVLYATRGGRSYILTSNDLVSGHIEVTFNDGERESAHLVDADPTSGLAIVSVGGDQRALPAFGSVADVRVAEPLLAVSGGELEGAPPSPLSVSAVDAATTISDDQTLIGMLAVTGSAATDEGGALVDARGQVVGITTSMTATDPNQQGTSYAIPIDVAAHVARQLLARAPVTHPYVGVLQAADLSSVTAGQLGVRGGALVEAVAPGSPAARAGISAADVITSVDGRPVTSAGSLEYTVWDCQPGAAVSVSYLREGAARPTTVTVRIAEQPPSIENPNGS
jgi:putative serine protease PepD